MAQRDIGFILEKLDRSIILTGMMGAGKSHIGRKLADALKLPFADSDRHIEEAAGISIPEIFARDGEERFRAAEKRVIGDLLSGGKKIVALGGGALMNPETAEMVRRNAVLVWLQADAETLARRIGSAETRPMLKGKDVRKTLEDLLKAREPVYKRAVIIVDSGDDERGRVVDEIIKRLAEHLRGKRA